MSYYPNIAFLDNTESQRKDGITIDPTADVHPSAYFEGLVVVGPHCQIDAGAIVTGVVFMGHHSVIGCNASIRGGVTIGNYVHIGDQVNIEGGRPPLVRSSGTVIPDKTILYDGCIIGPGTSMHGTRVDEGSVLGARCNCDYNTYIGKGCVLASGSATNVNQIVYDNCFVEGVPAVIKKENITDEDREAYLSYIPSVWVKKMAWKLEEMPADNRRLDNRIKKLKIDESASIHPTAILEGNIKIGPNTLIGAGAILIGDIDIGDHSYIALNAIVKGAVSIGSKTHICDHAFIDGAKIPDVEVRLTEVISKRGIGNSCMLSNGCAVRGSDIGDGATVGLAAVCDYGTVIASGGVLANGSATKVNQFISENCFAEGVPASIRNKDITDEGRADYFGFVPSKLMKDAAPKLETMCREKEIKRNLNIHPDAFIHPTAWLEGDITVGAYTYIDAGNILFGKISIGEYCGIKCNISFKGDVTVGNYTHVYDQISIDSWQMFMDAKKVVIGNNCWINHGCITRGVTVEDGGAVNLGACCEFGTHIGKGGTLGNHSSTSFGQCVPKNCLMAGVPSAIKKRFMTDVDRYDYFGVIPYVWTSTEDELLMRMVNERRGEK